MAKYPYMQFYTGDWLKDPALSLCTPATRGIWIDLISAMHEQDRSGQLRGTREQLSRVARCSSVELAAALTDLQSTGAADVTERNGLVTLINRRMQREYKSRTQGMLRVRRHRGNAPCNAPDTPHSSEFRVQNSNPPPAPPPPTPPPIAPTPPSGGGGKRALPMPKRPPLLADALRLAGETGRPAALGLALLERLAPQVKARKIESAYAVAQYRLGAGKDLPAAMDLQRLCQWCNAGMVAAVSGVVVTQPATWSERGLNFAGGRVAIPAAAITWESITLEQGVP